jgi:hypothetical protein
MAISDNATLVAAVKNWLARADLDSVIPDFITLAESRINRDLKVRQMLTTVGLTASSREFTLPTDIVSIVRVSARVSGRDKILEPLASVANINATDGLAWGYVVEGSVGKVVGGTGSEDITMSYYAKIPAVATSANWLITNYPDVYLYATLLEASPYLGNDARVSTWAQGYQSAIDSLNRMDSEARFGGAPRARLDFYAP